LGSIASRSKPRQPRALSPHGMAVNLVHLQKMGTFRDKGRNDSGAQ
jgi:hypothetical protein